MAKTLWEVCKVPDLATLKNELFDMQSEKINLEACRNNLEATRDMSSRLEAKYKSQLDELKGEMGTLRLIFSTLMPFGAIKRIKSKVALYALRYEAAEYGLLTVQHKLNNIKADIRNKEREIEAAEAEETTEEEVDEAFEEEEEAGEERDEAFEEEEETGEERDEAFEEEEAGEETGETFEEEEETGEEADEAFEEEEETAEETDEAFEEEEETGEETDEAFEEEEETAEEVDEAFEEEETAEEIDEAFEEEEETGEETDEALEEEEEAAVEKPTPQYADPAHGRPLPSKLPVKGGVINFNEGSAKELISKYNETGFVKKNEEKQSDGMQNLAGLISKYPGSITTLPVSVMKTLGTTNMQVAMADGSKQKMDGFSYLSGVATQSLEAQLAEARSNGDADKVKELETMQAKIGSFMVGDETTKGAMKLVAEARANQNAGKSNTKQADRSSAM